MKFDSIPWPFLAMLASILVHQVVLPFPDEEKTFGYTDKDIPILGRFVDCLEGFLEAGLNFCHLCQVHWGPRHCAENASWSQSF